MKFRVCFRTIWYVKSSDKTTPILYYIRLHSSSEFKKWAQKEIRMSTEWRDFFFQVGAPLKWLLFFCSHTWYGHHITASPPSSRPNLKGQLNHFLQSWWVVSCKLFHRILSSGTAVDVRQVLDVQACQMSGVDVLKDLPF